MESQQQPSHIDQDVPSTVGSPMEPDPRVVLRGMPDVGRNPDGIGDAMMLLFEADKIERTMARPSRVRRAAGWISHLFSDVAGVFSKPTFW